MIKKIKQWIFDFRKKRKIKKKLKDLRKRDPFIYK
tara:strand:- start:2500 stop:2604 length:105 start_codon:yes stop_codon:yes gene_type:complete